MKMERFPKWLPVMFALLTIFTPEDGLAEPLDNWHSRNPLTEGNSLRVSHGNGIFVAVGEFGAIYTSSDGAAWTSRTSGTHHPLNDVTYGSSTFVAVGYSGTILNSQDGVTWTTRNSGTSYNLSGVAYSSNTFVAVGDNGAIVTSPNGAGWAVRDSGTHQGLKKVAFGNNTFVAVGMNGNILTSPNGANWTVEASGTSGHLEGIAYGKNTFVAVGEAILTSSDGITWTERGPKTNHRFFGVAYGSGTFAAVAENGAIFTSPDGSGWTQRNSGTHLTLLAIAYGEENFVAAGENGTLLQSDSLPSPQISVSSTSLDFGSVNVGNSSSQTLTITNSGSADLILQRLTIAGANVIDFITQNDHCTGTTLSSSQNCTVQIVFSPHLTGSASATLSISSNDPVTPTQTVSLSGSSGGFSVSSTGSNCFISFSAAGSGLENYLEILRKFRDVFLLESELGKTLVDFYYQHSPSLAKFVARHDFMKEGVRMGLIPLVALSYVALYTSPVEKALLFALMHGVGLAGFIIRGRSRRLRETRVRDGTISKYRF
jgi:hypothetical protein